MDGWMDIAGNYTANVQLNTNLQHLQCSVNITEPTVNICCNISYDIALFLLLQVC